VRLAEIQIENFRIFGEGVTAFRLTLPAGIAALVGENDSGKTAIVDAIRLVLGTRGQDYFRVGHADFHQPPDGGVARNAIRILLRFDALSAGDRGAFLEHLTYLDGKAHPQRQHLLINFLKQKAIVDQGAEHGLQVLMTTHRPKARSRCAAVVVAVEVAQRR